MVFFLKANTVPDKPAVATIPLPTNIVMANVHSKLAVIALYRPHTRETIAGPSIVPG